MWKQWKVWIFVLLTGCQTEWDEPLELPRVSNRPAVTMESALENTLHKADLSELRLTSDPFSNAQLPLFAIRLVGTFVHDKQWSALISVPDGRVYRLYPGDRLLDTSIYILTVTAENVSYGDFNSAIRRVIEVGHSWEREITVSKDKGKDND